MGNQQLPTEKSELTESQKDSIEYQRKRYNSEALEHVRHHGDQYSQMYRTEFIRSKLFNFDLQGKIVLDAMCASGVETEYLISKGAIVTGLDISERNAEIYQEKWHRECIATSIHDTKLNQDSFDVVYIFGGLHHVIPCLGETIREVYRLLKPGGYFVFVEPNKDTWFNALRMLWYRFDSRFQKDEEALSYKNQLRPFLDLGFREVTSFKGGNIAYLLISQSLIIGTPKSWKKWLYPVLSNLERLITRIPIVPRLFLAAVWQKKPDRN